MSNEDVIIDGTWKDLPDSNEEIGETKPQDPDAGEWVEVRKPTIKTTPRSDGWTDVEFSQPTIPQYTTPPIEGKWTEVKNPDSFEIKIQPEEDGWNRVVTSGLPPKTTGTEKKSKEKRNTDRKPILGSIFRPKEDEELAKVNADIEAIKKPPKDAGIKIAQQQSVEVSTGTNKGEKQPTQQRDPHEEDKKPTPSNTTTTKDKKEEKEERRVITEEERSTYVDKKGQKQQIPLPLKEEMDLVFDKNYPAYALDSTLAYEVGVMENNLYDQKLKEREDELLKAGYSTEEIEKKMIEDKYLIKQEVQRFVKGSVTNRFRNKVIKRIQDNPEKYKDFIDPATGEVISDLKDDNLIGYILGQKVYPEWMKEEDPNYHKREDNILDPIPIETPEFTELKIKIEQQQTLINNLNNQIEQQNKILLGILEREKAKLEAEKEKRINKRIAIVAGAGALVTGLLLGPQVAVTGAIVSGAGGLVAKGTSLFAEWKINRWTKEMNKTQDPAKKLEIQARIVKWQNANKWAKRTASFFLGTGIGFGVSSLFTKVFMGGKGLLNRAPVEGVESVSNYTQPEITNNSQVNPQGSSVSQPPVVETPPTGIETGGEGILLQNGRVHLPGSAWDGNLATPPTGNLPGGEFVSSNFVGGATNMGAFNLENALQTYKVSRNAIDTLGPQRTHQLLNLFQANPRINLLDALNQLGIDKALLGIAN